MLSHTLIKYSKLFLRNIDTIDIRIFLESSPLYPNLLSVLQTLQYVGLEAQADQCDWEYLKNLKTPFLLHLRIKYHETLVISIWDHTHNTLKILHPTKDMWETKTKEDIKNVWDGVVIYTDATQIRNIRAQKNLLAGVAVASFILILCTVITNWRNEVIYTLPIWLGLVVSLCIYWQNYISPIKIVDKICHSSSMTDCDAVEKSQYSKFGGLNMSSMAASYFLSQLSCLMMSWGCGISNAIYTMYLIAAIVVLPMTVYSVYSQYKVGKICPMCIIILTCVILQTALFCYMPQLPINLWILTIWTFCAICFLGLLTLCSQFQLARQDNLSTKIENLKLKRNREVFLIESSFCEPVKAPIMLGAETSQINITTIISPNCRHCRKIVSELFSLTKRKIEFRWNIILGKTTERDAEIINVWIQSYLSDKDKFINELYLWSIEEILTLSATGLQSLEVTDIIQDNDKQVEKLKISGFPQIILNDRLLSSVYSTEDLEFIIADQWEIMRS